MMTTPHALLCRMQKLQRQVNLDRFAAHRLSRGVALYECVPRGERHEVYLFGTFDAGQQITVMAKYANALVSHEPSDSTTLQPTIEDFVDYMHGNATARAMILAHDRTLQQRDIHGRTFRFADHGAWRDMFISAEEFHGLLHEDLTTMILDRYDLTRQSFQSAVAGTIVEKRELQEQDVCYVNNALRDLEGWIMRSLR